MRLTADNTWTRVEELTGEGRQFLYDFLSVEAPGAKHNPAVKAGRWDGMIRLFDHRRDRFPTGLLRMALGALKASPFAADVVDTRQPPCAWVAGRAAWLFPDQLAALDACRRRTRGIVQSPTGSGKTEIFVGAAASVPDTNVVLLTGSKDLMEQAAARFEQRTGERAGRIGAGQWAPARFTAATYQALHRRRKGADFAALAAATGMLIVDEGHELPAASFYDTAMAFDRAYWRFGLSATPCLRRDAQELKMMAALGVVIHKVSPEPLIEDGRLARPYIWFVEHQHESMKGSWEEIYEAAIVLNDARNQVVVQLAADEGRRAPTIVFVKAIEHGRRLEGMLRAAGVSCAFVHGDTPDRMRYAERLVRRDLEVLVASKVFFTGVDIPEAEAGINAGAGDSGVDAIQRLGRLTRGPRKVPGKTACRYYDFRDLGIASLSRHAKHRWEVYEDYGDSFRPQIARTRDGVQHQLIG